MSSLILPLHCTFYSLFAYILLSFVYLQVLLRLDTSRNELLVANTVLAILGCSIAFSAYITGIFGMNLNNTKSIQPVENVFQLVFAGTFALIFCIFFIMLGYVQKMFPKRVNNA
jgi:hypothetical protein